MPDAAFLCLLHRVATSCELSLTIVLVTLCLPSASHVSILDTPGIMQLLQNRLQGVHDLTSTAQGLPLLLGS